MMLDKIADNNRLFSYVVADDNGSAPNPDFGICTLAICKPDIRRTAKVGDVIVGLASKAESNRVVYCMVVDEVLKWEEYVERCHNNHILKQKIPDSENNSGDCIWYKEGSLSTNPLSSWSGHNEKEYQKDVVNGVNVLLSRQFWYFGRGDNYELYLPEYLHGMHVGRKYHSGKNNEFKDRFVDFFNSYLDENGITVIGKLGTPEISSSDNVNVTHRGCGCSC